MGRKAFVTGGSRGIGRAVSLALAGSGADVAIGYRSRDEDAAEAAAAVRALGREAVLVRGDVGAEPDALVERAAAELGGLDAVVWCAVEPLRATVLDLTREQLERSLSVNAAAFVLGAQRAAALMGDGGRIVAVSATGGHRIRNPEYAPLGIAKGALEAAVRFLAVAVAPRGITVNAVAPGPTETEAFDAMSARSTELKAELARRTPLGRMGRPEDAARLIAWLCSEDGGWVTGHLLFSDGGYTLA